jgi:hypothetical protein
MSGLDTLLIRAKGARKAPARKGIARAYRMHCPSCQGHGLPLSAGETEDGCVLLHCFAGCEPDAVLSGLGLKWNDVLPPRPLAHLIKGNAGPHGWASVYSAGESSLRALERAFCLLSTADKPDGEQEFEEYLKAVFEAAAELQNFKKFMRAVVRGGNAK